MKKLILLLLVLNPIILHGEKDVIYVAFQPNRYIPDSGIGLGYEREFNKIGAYASVIRGKYSYGDLGGLHQLKSRIGITRYMFNDGLYKFFFAGGLNYSILLNNIYENDSHRMSFDGGFGAKIEKYKVVLLYDPLNKESEVKLGLAF